MPLRASPANWARGPIAAEDQAKIAVRVLHGRFFTPCSTRPRRTPHTGRHSAVRITREAWLAARKELLAKEKELTRLRDELNAERRDLPMAVTLGWHDAVRIPDLRTIIGLSQQAFFRRSCCPEHREEQCAEA